MRRRTKIDKYEVCLLYLLSILVFNRHNTGEPFCSYVDHLSSEGARTLEKEVNVKMLLGERGGWGELIICGTALVLDFVQTTQNCQGTIRL